MKILLFWMAFGLFVFSSCKKEPENPEPQTGLYDKEGMFILNEGISPQTGSVYFYAASGEVYKDIFQSANNRDLGQWVSQMQVIGGKAYISVSSANAIEVVNLADFKSVATISNNLSSPRVLLPVSSSKAYVSNWYTDNSIAVIDLQTNQVTKTLSYGNIGPDEMLIANNKVFITNAGIYEGFSLKADSTVMVIDPATDEVIDTIYVGYSPESILSDQQGNIWVLCSGLTDWTVPANSKPSMLFKIDPADHSIDAQYTIGTGNYPEKLQIDKNGQYLLYLDLDGVYKFNITGGTLPSAPFISGDYYGLGIDPHNNTINATYVPDFTQKGYLLRYNFETGAFISDTITAGIGPGLFLFR